MLEKTLLWWFHGNFFAQVRELDLVGTRLNFELAVWSARISLGG